MPNKNVPLVQSPVMQPGTPETVDRKPEPAGDASKNGLARLPVALLIASVLLLVVLFLLIIWRVTRSDPCVHVHALFFVGLLIIFPLIFISLDVVLFDRKRSQLPDNTPANKPAYHPNLRIWGFGLMMGIGATIIYLIGDVILSLNSKSSVTNETIHQYVLLLVVLTIGVCFTIWGIVRVCQSE